jgi:hypothetical protein
MYRDLKITTVALGALSALLLAACGGSGGTTGPASPGAGGQRIDTNRIDACLGTFQNSDSEAAFHGDFNQYASNPDIVRQAVLEGGSVHVWTHVPGNLADDETALTLYSFKSERAFRSAKSALAGGGNDVMQAGLTLAYLNSDTADTVRGCLRGFKTVSGSGSGQGGSGGSPASAKELARTAQTAAETYATDHNGSYAGITPAVLAKVEGTIPTSPNGSAYLSSAVVSDGGQAYAVTTTVGGGVTFTISRNAAGTIARTCVPASSNDCAGGQW